MKLLTVIIVLMFLPGCDDSKADRYRFCQGMNYVLSERYTDFCYDPETDRYFSINKLKESETTPIEEAGE